MNLFKARELPSRIATPGAEYGVSYTLRYHDHEDLKRKAQIADESDSREEMLISWLPVNRMMVDWLIHANLPSNMGHERVVLTQPYSSSLKIKDFIAHCRELLSVVPEVLDRVSSIGSNQEGEYS